jgi:arylformamidase
MADYDTMSDQEIEREYSPSSMVGGDSSGYQEAYAALSAQARAMFPHHADVRYGELPTQVIDIFPALGGLRDAPLYVFVHGGYWQRLSHKDGATMAAAALREGYAFATVGYTLAPEATIESMVGEVGRAIGHLQGEAGRYGYDGHRIVAAGHSAGAQLLAQQLTIASEQLAFDPRGITHMRLLGGIYDLRPLIRTATNAPLGLDGARAEALSPLLRPLLHPVDMLVIPGAYDTAEFRRQSLDFAKHAQAHGAHATFSLAPGRDHFDLILDPEVTVPAP